MYVCLCQGVTDNQIRQAVHQGCANFRELRSRLGVASQCGKCARSAKQLLRETQREIAAEQSASSSLFFALA
ncbi:(2Fe-2S)-binding protein [Ventosimonas gracilis]|uniref:Bacterioferritin-associated ferredoxin n=1 Tax=Ventosimonas gracilis TaxID=1680762 RepID=A0A139SV99_9GAMM|nr:bacterioferritin-associated ferredoxin [Ventosimonas gracilis]KXU38538.1 (2Fe-2S)-binding protein [Ventosimonas gracilis]